MKKTSKRLLLAALMMGCSFGAVHDAFAEEAARTPAEAEDSQRTAQENADSEYQLPDLTVLGDRKTFRGGMIERKSTTGILGERDSLELPFSVTTVSQKAIETFSTPQSGVMDTLSRPFRTCFFEQERSLRDDSRLPAKRLFHVHQWHSRCDEFGQPALLLDRKRYRGRGT